MPEPNRPETETMNPKIAIPLCSMVLTAFVLLVLQRTWSLPIWPVFIAWACFFHLGGGEDPRGAAKALLSCALFGVFMAWLNALLILINPAGAWLPGTIFAPILIAISIGVIVAAASWKPLSTTSVCIYGYAAVWAFLDAPGRFELAKLTSYSAENVLLAVPCGIVLGCLCGYLNAKCVGLLVRGHVAVELPTQQV
jgi:hypothetical protein